MILVLTQRPETGPLSGRDDTEATVTCERCGKVVAASSFADKVRFDPGHVCRVKS